MIIIIIIIIIAALIIAVNDITKYLNPSISEGQLHIAVFYTKPARTPNAIFAILHTSLNFRSNRI